MIPFLDLQGQYLGLKPEMDAAITEVLTSAHFIGGKAVEAFETNFATFQGADHCIGVGNGTDALEIVIEALDLPANSEVIVPVNSFIASSEAVTRSGHRVVFCDADPHTYLLDLADVRTRATQQTAAVICVHLYGNPCNMDELLEWARPLGLRVIEDAAQAHGAEWKERRVGALGDVGTFSFYPGKNLGAYGDAGAIVTNDAELARRCRMIANHGRVHKYDHEFEGRNSRLDSMQAAVLGVKLRYLNGWIDRRNQIAAKYMKGLTGLHELALPAFDPTRRHACHLFVVRTARRDRLRDHLAAAGIQCGIHYPTSLARLPAYTYLDPEQRMSFRADDFGNEVLSLPMGEHLSDTDVETVIEAVTAFFDTSSVG